ncbi:MAG: hypothetical protein ACR2FN_00770 [Chitinophagaceae bacterium]
MKKVLKKNLFLICSSAFFIAIAIIACTKQQNHPNEDKSNIQTGIQYDKGLLQEFRDYQAKISSAEYLKSSAKSTSSSSKRILILIN